jgi:hypothetical protein
MGRHPLPENELKKRVSVRLKQEMIDEIKKHGSLQNVIEKALEVYLSKKVE